MKKFIVSFLFAGSLASAQEPKSDLKDLEQDFTVACEIAKMSAQLRKTPAFKSDGAQAAELSYKLTEMAIKTPEAKSAQKAAAMADIKFKSKLWRQAAADAGLKNWKCKAL